MQDMRQLFGNCKNYNPTPTDPVRLACLRLSETFEQQWINSGLCAEAQRAKRANAGIAAPKFEPEEYDGMAPRPHRSGGDAKRPQVRGGSRSEELGWQQQQQHHESVEPAGHVALL